MKRRACRMLPSNGGVSKGAAKRAFGKRWYLGAAARCAVDNAESDHAGCELCGDVGADSGGPS